MSKKQPRHETKDFLKLQKEWYSKLSEEGFYDIEGGVEGHLLRGPNSSVSLRALANKKSSEQGLKQDFAPREFDEVADESNVDLLYTSGAKARYFHHAALLAAQAVAEGWLCDDTCWTWQLHAEGDGERVISDLLEIPRSKVRKYLAHLRYNIFDRLDNPSTV